MTYHRRQTIALLVCLLVASGSFLGLIAAEPGAGICERAFFECLTDPLNQAMGYLGMIYCGIGYAFCKKYIDPA